MCIRDRYQRRVHGNRNSGINMHEEAVFPQNDQYLIKKLIGQGSFSTIYSAFDRILKKPVAMKIEKPGKSKKILKFESQVLRDMQGLPHTCKLYDYVSAADLNSLSYIVMQLLGKDLSTICLLYTSPSPRDLSTSRMPSSA
eukprot:TRINITY_DN2396_c0_g1_i5.p1 TRINITY_DN2396_c0_g1~~TRINITY_DN2396_c0_g1_i5.p1  ORF type:complete len:141 (-),score=26.76 TRINITY_DN2396_c0_g1_i5:135-557(-)